MTEHPQELLKLKIGDEVWVRAKVRKLSEQGTIGWAQGIVEVDTITRTHITTSEHVCTDVRNIMTAEGLTFENIKELLLAEKEKQ